MLPLLQQSQDAIGLMYWGIVHYQEGRLAYSQTKSFQLLNDEGSINGFGGGSTPELIGAADQSQTVEPLVIGGQGSY